MTPERLAVYRKTFGSMSTEELRAIVEGRKPHKLGEDSLAAIRLLLAERKEGGHAAVQPTGIPNIRHDPPHERHSSVVNTPNAWTRFERVAEKHTPLPAPAQAVQEGTTGMVINRAASEPKFLSIVRYIRRKVKGCKPAGFVGKGTIRIEGKTLVLQGKKCLSLGEQIAVFLGVNMVCYFISKLFGGGVFFIGIPLALLIDVFARTRHSISINFESVRSISRDVEHSRFALTAVTSDTRPIEVAWQVTEDAKPLGERLQACFKAPLRDERIHGDRTF